ncbi:TauD/TfdA dioxygenase family protein [Paracidovorax citrulli]
MSMQRSASLTGVNLGLLPQLAGAQAADAILAGAAHEDFAIRAFDAPLGAEVVGLDLSRALSPEALARIHAAHLQYHVLVFRDQQITPAQQIAFSRHFGELQIHVLHQFALADHPEVLVVSNIVENGKPIGLGDAGHFWHSDLSYKERPSLGSLLHARELPAEGGDTLFANQHLAWETLPEALRRAVEGRLAEHTYLARYEELRQRSPWRPALSAEQIAQVKPVTHPIVRTHPETGRKALFVSEHFTTRIVGLPEDESRALLDELFAHSVKPAFVYRHQWRPHDLVFWDNRSLQHLAAGCPPQLRRLMYRTTIEGDKPY